eukprot:8155357-Alexandrium_andersonii.AAC.1
MVGHPVGSREVGAGLVEVQDEGGAVDRVLGQVGLAGGKAVEAVLAGDHEGVVQGSEGGEAGE